VAWALLWYAAGLVGHALVEVFARAFYALHDTRTPVSVGVVAMSLNITFSLAFSAWFNRLGLPPLGGLALANSLATALEMVGLLVLMHRLLNGLHGGKILRMAAGAGLASLVMGAALWAFMRLMSGQHQAVLVVGGIVFGGMVYAGMLIALRIDEVRLVWTWVNARLRFAPRS